MAQGDTWHVTVRYSNDRNAYESSFWYEETTASDNDAQAGEFLADAWFTKFVIDAPRSFANLLHAASLVESAYARKVQVRVSRPDPPLPNTANPGLFTASDENGTRGTARAIPQDCLVLNFRAEDMIDNKIRQNRIFVSALADDDINNGAFTQAYLDGPVATFITEIQETVTDMGTSAIWTPRVAVFPATTNERLLPIAQVIGTARVGNQKRRQARRIGTFG